MLRLVSVVNRVRKERRRRPLDAKRVVRYRRRIVKPFEVSWPGERELGVGLVRSAGFDITSKPVKSVVS